MVYRRNPATTGTAGSGPRGAGPGSSRPRTGPVRPGAAPQHLGLALVVISMAQLMLVLDELIVNTALPHIQHCPRLLRHRPGVDRHRVCAITFGGLLLLGGRAGDILGRRRMFIAGVTAFALASLLAGLATTPGLAHRLPCPSGCRGGGRGARAALSLIAVTFPEGRQRNRALGVYAAMTGMGGAVGVIAGGLLTTYASWRWVFFVNVPIGLLLAAGARFVLPESQAAPAPAGPARRDRRHGRVRAARLRPDPGRDWSRRDLTLG